MVQKLEKADEPLVDYEEINARNSADEEELQGKADIEEMNPEDDFFDNDQIWELRQKTEAYKQININGFHDGGNMPTTMEELELLTNPTVWNQKQEEVQQ